MARPPSTQPTDAELEILKILWEQGPAGLGRVHAEIQERRQVALTTIATTLKTMLAKGLVARDDGPRGYVWSAVASRGSTATGLLGKLVQHVFDGSARRLVAHMIQEGALDDRDRDEIRALLEAAPPHRRRRRREAADEPTRHRGLSRLDGGRLDHAPPRLDRAAVGLVVALLRRLLRPARPETRHVVAVACLLTLAAAPVMIFASALPARVRDGVRPSTGRPHHTAGRTGGRTGLRRRHATRAVRASNPPQRHRRSRSRHGSSRWSATCPASGWPARWRRSPCSRPA